MAKAELILQAVTNRHHAGELTKLLAHPDATAVTISVAFVRTLGLTIIESTLAELKFKPKFFVGIRNDITSVQAVRRLFDLDVELYTVDTGSRRPIFHPKLYIVKAKTTAFAIIGSANLTYYGLTNNIEASALLELDLSEPSDAAFVKQVFETLDGLPTDHPEHVVRIKSHKDIEQLFADSKLCDETIVTAPSPSQIAKGLVVAQTPKMKLFQISTHSKKSTSKSQASKAKKPYKVPTQKSIFVKVWHSKPLAERDLNVPSGESTNATGIIGLKADAFYDFDFQIYFRAVVFAELKWTPRPSVPYKEDATATFQFVIENIDYGEYELVLFHDNRTYTRSFLQRNIMTELHWGTAKSIVARKDLIGRSLILYKKFTDPPMYLIEID